MRSILEELWYGNVCPNTGCREATKEAKELMGYIADHHDNLQATLTDKQKEILEKFEENMNEMHGITERDAFSYGFRLGVQLMAEAFLQPICDED